MLQYFEKFISMKTLRSDIAGKTEKWGFKFSQEQCRNWGPLPKKSEKHRILFKEL